LRTWWNHHSTRALMMFHPQATSTHSVICFQSPNAAIGICNVLSNQHAVDSYQHLCACVQGTAPRHVKGGCCTIQWARLAPFSVEIAPKRELQGVSPRMSNSEMYNYAGGQGIKGFLKEHAAWPGPSGKPPSCYFVALSKANRRRNRAFRKYLAHHSWLKDLYMWCIRWLDKFKTLNHVLWISVQHQARCMAKHQQSKKHVGIMKK
jgi:hypothetical protein